MLKPQIRQYKINKQCKSFTEQFVNFKVDYFLQCIEHHLCEFKLNK